MLMSSGRSSQLCLLPLLRPSSPSSQRFSQSICHQFNLYDTFLCVRECCRVRLHQQHICCSQLWGLICSLVYTIIDCSPQLTRQPMSETWNRFPFVRSSVHKAGDVQYTQLIYSAIILGLSLALGLGLPRALRVPPHTYRLTSQTLGSSRTAYASSII